MRRTSFLGVAVGILFVLAACGGGPAATPGPGATAAPGVTAAPGQTTAPVITPAPQATPPPVAGSACAAIPTFSLETPQPSFPQDLELNARFPTQIDGQPVTGVTSVSWVAFVCYLGGQAGYDEAVAKFPAGFNLNALVFANSQANVDGETVQLQAFRVAGQDANQLVQALLQYAAGSDSPGTVSQANVGGKNVYAFTQDGEIQGYAYASGDVVFTVDGVTPEQAAKIFAAIP